MAEGLLERAGVQPGMEVLDVACGTGNASLPAGRLGARVTGLDSRADMIDVARERAADGNAEVDWVEGHAEQLPFEDASFERVLSIFGHMFASDQERTAAELLRVCRPGGVIGFCAWTPEGMSGRDLVGPERWGSEERVTELLGGQAELELERLTVAFPERSHEEWEYLLVVASLP